MNRAENIKDLVNKRIIKAEKDLLTAERELAFEDTVTDTVWFQCQRTVDTIKFILPGPIR